MDAPFNSLCDIDLGFVLGHDIAQAAAFWAGEATEAIRISEPISWIPVNRNPAMVRYFAPFAFEGPHFVMKKF